MDKAAQYRPIFQWTAASKSNYMIETTVRRDGIQLSRRALDLARYGEYWALLIQKCRARWRGIGQSNIGIGARPITKLGSLPNRAADLAGRARIGLLREYDLARTLFPACFAPSRGAGVRSRPPHRHCRSQSGQNRGWKAYRNYAMEYVKTAAPVMVADAWARRCGISPATSPAN